MVQHSATTCSCIAILWVSLVSFASIILCVASQRVFVVDVVYFVIDSVRKLLDTPSYLKLNFYNEVTYMNTVTVIVSIHESRYLYIRLNRATCQHAWQVKYHTISGTNDIHGSVTSSRSFPMRTVIFIHLLSSFSLTLDNVTTAKSCRLKSRSWWWRKQALTQV